MINDTPICALAKKLNGVNSKVVIDDPAKVQELLLGWFLRDSPDIMGQIEALTEEEDNILTDFFRRHFTSS